jgi:serine/threonine-protein kinase
MGEVVEAEHLGLGKRVVVKLLRAELADNPELVRRMLIEARSLAALVSPHIVQVSDFGQTASGRTYLVMERLYGRTLAAELRERGALLVAQAIGCILEILAGLDVAHSMGIVHRDIKLENIFLCDPSRDTPRTVKILDFGIAKVLSVARDERAPALPHLATEEGSLVGTPRVVSPEQAYGRPVDARTDVYAVGLLLYNLVAGRSPFAHLSDHVDLIKAHVGEVPSPPSRHAPQPVPPALDAAILRALEKRPEDRFQSAAEFAAELRRIVAIPRAQLPLALDTTEPALVVPQLRPEAADARPEVEAATVQLRNGVCALAAEPEGAPHPLAEATVLGSSPAKVATADEDPTLALVGGVRWPAPRSAVRGTRWGAFVALVLLSAAISTVLLIVLYRVAEP